MYQQITSNKRKSVLLTTLFVAVVLLLGWLIGQITNTGSTFLIIAIVLSIMMSFTGYFAGDKIALATSGAKQIKKQDNPYVWRLIENLCITAGLPMPKVYIIDDPAPNAFACGRDPKHASIALTTGIINMLENEELEGVIAHELSHIKNYDIRLMTLVGVLLGTVVLLSEFFIRGSFFGMGRRRDSQGGNMGTILMIAGIVLAILSPIIAQLIQLAISRKREFLADASGALLTRYPEGLASALEKISQYPKPLRHAKNAMAHFYIINPFGKTKVFMSKMFSTHPPVEERIKALREMM